MKIFNFQCQSHQYVDLHNSETPVCKDCPENCSICYQNHGSEVICTHCQQKYYLDSSTQKCEKCYKNCLSCDGPKLNHCFQAELGYQYNDEKKGLVKCEIEGCLHCSTLDTCNSCKPGFLHKTEINKENNKMITKCIDCGIENCRFCVQTKDQITNQFLTTCKICLPGYGKLNNKCEKCQENCVVCSNDYQKCQICKMGYFLDKKNSQCQKIEIDNCYSLQNGDQTKCKSCFAHFYLKEDTCKSCQAEVPNCQACKYENDSAKCTFCIMGYFLKDNQCLECPENCRHCDSDKCHNCDPKFYYDSQTKKCEKCNIKKCRVCQSKDKCIQCDIGLYFDENKKKCVKCKDNCLRCSLDGKYCFLCPLNYLTLNEKIINEKPSLPKTPAFGPFQIISQMLNNVFSNFLNPAFSHFRTINIHKKCVKKCPEEIEGQKVRQDKARRICFVQLHDEEQNTSLDDTIKVDKNSNILETLNNLLANYEHQLDEVEKIQGTKIVEGYSKECNYYGKLHKEIKGNMTSYYVCKCEFNRLGDNCEISMNLYNQTQRKLIEIFQMEETKFAKHNMHEQKILFKALATSTRFKIGIDVVEKMINMIQQSLVMNRQIENSLDLYVLLDSIVLNVFDLIEDLKRENSSFQTLDIGSEHNRERYYQNMHVLLQIIENSLEEMDYAKSFLNPQKQHFYNLDTFSFMVNEFQLRDSDNNFQIDNPNIDTSFNINENTILKFDINSKLDQGIAKDNVQILNFSAMIFADKLKALQKVAVTNIIYVKFLSSSNSTHLISNRDIDLSVMHIEFPLLFIPAFDNVEENVECLAISFYTNKETYKGQVIRLSEDDDSKFGCDFRPFFDFRNYYFVFCKFVQGNITCSLLNAQQKINIDNQFKSLDLLGKGGFGLVKGDKNIVIKQILLRRNEELLANREIRCMDAFKNQFDIVQFYDNQSCNYSIASYQHIFLYYKTYRYDRDLLAFMQAQGNTITIFKMLDIFFKMTLALHKFHVAGFIHADLKEINYFMMNDYTVVLGDLGLSMSLFEKTDFKVGTKHYSAPETQKRRVTSVDYTTHIDTYSQGIIFFDLVFGVGIRNPQQYVKDYLEKKCVIIQNNNDESYIFRCYMAHIIQNMISIKIKKRTPAEGVARQLLQIMKIFKKNNLGYLNQMMNEEYVYYKSINSDSREVEQVYKEQLLAKFELRKQIYFEEDFNLRPTVLNSYVKLDVKVPNEYKNIDNSPQPFIPIVDYLDRSNATTELRQAQQEQARLMEQERLNRLQGQQDVNIVYDGLAAAGGALYNLGVGLFNWGQETNEVDQEQQALLLEQQRLDEEVDNLDLKDSKEPISNMLLGVKRPQFIKKFQPINLKAVQKQEYQGAATHNMQEDQNMVNSQTNQSIVRFKASDSQEDYFSDEDEQYAKNVPNTDQKKNMKPLPSPKNFREDNVQNAQYNNKNSQNTQQKVYTLQDLIGTNNNQRRIQHFFDKPQYDQLSPKHRPGKPMHDFQNIEGYGSDDQKHNMFQRQKPQMMFLQQKKKYSILPLKGNLKQNDQMENRKIIII